MTDRPFYIRDYHRFGLDYLDKCGYEIEIWRILYQGCLTDLDVSERLYISDNYHELYYFELKDMIARQACSLFYLHNLKSDFGLKVIRSGKKYFDIDGMCGIMRIPDCNEMNKTSIRERIIRRMEWGGTGTCRNIISHLQKIFHNIAFNRAIHLNPPIFSVASTGYMASTCGMSSALSHHIIFTHSYDYDRFLESQMSNEGERCIVFCDSGYYDHDYDFEEKYGEAATSKDKNAWYKLGILFDKLEKHYDLPVIIAGHPHTKYLNDHPTGRKLVFDQIANLTKNAELFITNTSTALSIAILNDAPILQVISSEFKSVEETPEVSMYEFISWQSECLGTGLIDVDNIEEIERPWEYVRRVSEDKRVEYIKKYIIDNDTGDRLVIELINDKIKKMVGDEVATVE